MSRSSLRVLTGMTWMNRTSFTPIAMRLLLMAGDDEGLIMLVGSTGSGRLVEIGFVISDDNVHVIVHAMAPARPKYLR